MSITSGSLTCNVAGDSKTKGHQGVSGGDTEHQEGDVLGGGCRQGVQYSSHLCNIRGLGLGLG